MFFFFISPAGSDVVGMKCKVDRVDGGYVLNGNKMWCTNGPIAQTPVVYAKTDMAAHSKGITTFIIEKGIPGFSTAQKLDKLGMRGSDLGLCDDVGFRFRETCSLSWTYWTHQACLDVVLPYVRQREQFGRPIGEFQLMQEARKRFDKASLLYDQAREKFMSLKKGTKSNIAILLEEDLHNSRATFEQARFNLVTALSNVEAKKRFEFLEAVSGTVDSHLRHFKQGYELLHQMKPYINQVLTYAQQSRERSNYEQATLNERMQDYKRQIDRKSRWCSSPNGGGGDGIQANGRSSHKMIGSHAICFKGKGSNNPSRLSFQTLLKFKG